MRTVTFYPTAYGGMFATHAYEVALSRLRTGEDVETTQMCLLGHPGSKEYDLIRIVSGPDDVIEIHNNHDGTYDCDRTERRLRRVHDFFHLWENGGFDR